LARNEVNNSKYIIAFCSCCDNQISRIVGLEALQNLERLDLSFNKISIIGAE